jgi:hypothetical protein
MRILALSGLENVANGLFHHANRDLGEVSTFTASACSGRHESSMEGIMTKGKCPACESLIDRVFFDSVNVMPGLFSDRGWKGITYLCPYCQAVLGVGIDPVALKTDTVSEVAGQVQTSLAPILGALNEIIARLNRMR